MLLAPNAFVDAFEQDATQGSTVAGGNGPGGGQHQLENPHGVAVDSNGTLLVADSSNRRIMRWEPGATQGSTVAGGNGPGGGQHQLNCPLGVAVDSDGTLLVADSWNDRIMRWEPDATQGSTVAGGNGSGGGQHQLNCPMGVAVDSDGTLLVADSENDRIMRWEIGQLIAWNPEMNHMWPPESKSLVKLLLLIDMRLCHQRGPGLGSLLITHVLPYGLPLCRQKSIQRHDEVIMSSWSRAQEQQHLSTIEDVLHLEPPAIIDQETAAMVVSVQEAGFIERNLETMVANGTEPGIWVEDTMPPESFTPLLLLNFTRHPLAFERAFSSSEMLREIREGLDRGGHTWLSPHGVKILVDPSQFSAASHAIVGLRLGASHVVTSEALVEVVLAVVNDLPSRENVKLKEVSVLAYTMGGMDGGTVIVRNTFLESPMYLRPRQLVLNSTSEAHRILNPRRRAQISN